MIVTALVVASFAAPGRAGAQGAPVIGALLGLQATLEGRYGDEGPEVSRRFDEVMQAVAGGARPVPAEGSGDADGPIAAYLTLTRATGDDAALAAARDTLFRAVQDVSRGLRPPSLSRFPQSALSEETARGTPRFPLARYADVFASAQRGQIDEAIARMKVAAATDPLVADAASRSAEMRQAAASLRRGSLRDATAALDTLVKTAPASSEAHRMLATVAAIGGDSRKSAEHFEAALRLRRDDERSWMALAGLQAENGSLVAAAQTLERAVAAVPGSGALRWNLAGLLVRLERVGDALVQYTEVERLLPVSGRAAVHQAVAAAASVQQDVMRAVDASERRVQANLNDAAAHRDLAGVYGLQGRQEQAFAELAIAAWLEPDDPMTFVMLGHSLMAARRDDEAVAALERAVMLQSDLREARYALAQALTRTSKRAEAERQLAEFERQRTEAVAREQRALDIAAIKDDAVRKSAAGEHRQAIASLEKVIALEPDVAQNYLNLAEALVKAGRLADSLQYFVKTTEMNGVAEVHLRLADVLARLGRVRESGLAHETYERLRLEDFRRRSDR